MKKIYIIILLAALLFLIIYGNIAFQSKPHSINYINLFLQISTNTSSVIQDNNLYFISPPRNTLSGSTILTNNEDEEKSIKISSDGQLAENGWLEIMEKSFSISPSQTKQIAIQISIPQNAKGNYTGRLIIDSE